MQLHISSGTIFLVGAAFNGAVCAAAFYARINLDRAARALERTRTHYNDRINQLQLDTLAQNDNLEMCGGCGAYLPPDEILLCPGKSCARFIKGIAPQQIMA